MTINNTMQRVPFGAVSIYRAVASLNHAVEAMTAALAPRRTVGLEGMTPAQLEDIGLPLANVEKDGPSIVSLWINRFVEWRDMQRTVTVLRGLSERQLDDVGLTDADLYRMERRSFF